MNDLPYTVKIHKSRQRDAEQWCRENLGKRWGAIDNKNGVWCCFWAGREDHAGYLFHFANEKDMIWVAMKWA